ncbi:30S ribosomal protein S2 [Candidatus Pacearchaeota archaeon]|nr:30S ribosomal protein S2 [Candidatus Pacearchaeota archaeon]
MGRKKLTDEEKAANKAARAAKKEAEKNIDEKKKEMAEKLKKIEEKVQIEKKEAKVELKEGKETKKEIKSETGTLIPIDDYVKAGSYIGTKVITPDMRKYVYRRRADGIAIINTNIIDEKLKEGAKFLSNYSPENFIVVCKREAGWRAVKLFSELTGVRAFTKKYPAGIITNTSLPNFFETDMIFICDPWLDKNALNDAKNVKIKVMGICDTNNLTKDIDVVMPANNKSNKSLGVIFYILAREYLKARNIDKKLPEMEEFIGEKLEELQPKKSKSQEEEKKKDIEKIESILKIEKEE